MFLLVPTAHVASHAGAIEDMEEDVRNNPDDASAHCKLAFNYLVLLEYTKAIKTFKQAIRLDPDNTIEARTTEHTVNEFSHYGLGRTFLWMDDRNAAKEQYRILKGLDTELANTLYDMIYK